MRLRTAINLPVRVPNQFRELASGAAWTFAGQALSRISVFGFLIISARTLPVGWFGSFVALQGAVLLASFFWDFGFSSFITRQLSRDEMTLETANAWLLSSRIIAMPVMFAFLTVVLRYFTPSEVGIAPSLLFLALAVISSLNLYLAAVAQAQLDFRRWNVAVVAGRIATLAISLSAFLVTPAHAYTLLVLALVLGETVTSSLLRGAAPQLISNPLRTISLAQGYRALRLSASYMLNSVFNIAYNRLDVVVVAVLAGSIQSGIYAPASRIQDAIMLVPGTFATVIFPTMGHRVVNQSSLRSSIIFTWISSVLCALLTIPLIVGMYLLAPLLPKMLGNGYEQSVPTLQIIVWSVLFISIAAPCFATLLAIRGARLLNYAYGGALLAAILGHIVLTTRFGAIGAAWTAVVRDAASCVIGLILLATIDMPARPDAACRDDWRSDPVSRTPVRD